MVWQWLGLVGGLVALFGTVGQVRGWRWAGRRPSRRGVVLTAVSGVLLVVGNAGLLLLGD